MNRLDFIAICAYYYTRELICYAAYTAAVLALMFMIYKLVGWALWIISM